LVTETIARYGLLSPGERVMVAFSGGADSTALTLVLEALGYRAVLGHVDHGMRPDSAADAEHCRRIAGELGLPVELARLPTPPSTEAQARLGRYGALEKMAGRAGVNRIATGHTLNDQAETVVLRLARGGYPLGIPPRRGRIVRPLIEVSRRDTEAFCRRHGVPFLVDWTNADLRYRRNLVRHRVLPGLGPEGMARLARLGEVARRRRERVAAATDTVLQGILVRRGAEIRLDRGRLLELPAALLGPVLRRALEEAGLEPSARLIADVAAKTVPVTGARLHLSGGWSIRCEPLELVVGPEVSSPELRPFRLTVPGRTISEEWGIELTAELVAAPGPPRCMPQEAFFHPRAAEGPLLVRPRLPGDRFRPLGGPGAKKLQDFFVDCKVPRGLRDRIPILTSRGEIVWVAGYRIDERFKLDEESPIALRLRILPLDSGMARS
ncbi:MAG: tRNA lysidine(34) synthetase TilS, partial [Actinomycetota bacterium]